MTAVPGLTAVPGTRAVPGLTAVPGTRAVPGTADAVVIGAGMVGVACAHYLAEAGLRVVVVDRGPVAGATSGSGEGNILVSDKEPGPELDLALLSVGLWRELGELIGPRCELEPKGGLVVAARPATADALARFAARQRAAGVRTIPVDATQLRQVEPRLAPGLAWGVLYPQDHQVQPMLAAALLLRHACSRGVTLITGGEVTAVRRDRAGRVAGVDTRLGRIDAPVVVNAAGPWAGALSERAGAPVPVQPRRGFVLVTEPLPALVRHKVYTAEYVADVASDAAALATSTVVEGTRAGTVLIGASRERVGFDPRIDWTVIARLAAGAVGLFPFLARARILRCYRGFRPYCPDHLPVIGPDPRLPGLVHACGHEGAGIGLAPATGALVAQVATGAPPALPLEPFSPTRFTRCGTGDDG